MIILELLNLPGLKTLSTEDLGGRYTVRVEGTVHQNTVCCRQQMYRHGSQKQAYMDTPMRGKRVLIEIDRRRFRCNLCGKTQFELLPSMDGKRQATRRLIKYIEERCLKETFVSLAREVGVDDKTIRFIFDDYVARRQTEVAFSMPEVMGIDELKIVGEYRAMLTNIDKLALFDMVHSRKKASLLEYFDSLPNKHEVKVLVMDMWQVYRQVGEKVFPGRLIVTDKFHVVRMAHDGLDRVRKRLRRSLDDRTRLKLKDDRWILLKRSGKLTTDELKVRNQWFDQFPALAYAYTAKERFFDIYTHPSRAAAEQAAREWVDSLDPLIAHDFLALQVALRNWWTEIFNYYEKPVSNDYTESVNNVTRFINRMGRGYSFEVLRARLLYDDNAVKNASAFIRKKVRRDQTPDGVCHMPRPGTFNNDYEETVTQYGAHLPTLARLLEDGYFS